MFNEKDVVSKIDYRRDGLGKNNLIKNKTKQDEEVIRRFKAFIQEYYTHLNKRDYLPQPDKKNRLAMADVKRR
jgi:hypothetical protein